MKWIGRAGSRNIEDRRGMSGGGMAVGGGIGGLVLLLLISALTGQNPAGYHQHRRSVFGDRGAGALPPTIRRRSS